MSASSPSRPLVRAARPEDLTQVRTLLVDSMERDHGYGYRPDWHADFDDLQGHYLSPPDSGMVVAEVDGRVVGAVALSPHLPCNPSAVAERYRAGSCLQVVRLVVCPSARRRGVASALVESIIELARSRPSVSVLCLHTNADNPSSVAFWRSTGAVEVLDERHLLPADAAYHALHLEIGLTAAE